MEPQLQQRVIGAAVLVAVGVVFIPMFLDDTPVDQPIGIDESSQLFPPEDFNSKVVPLDTDTLEAVEKAMFARPHELIPNEAAAADPPLVSEQALAADEPETASVDGLVESVPAAPRTGLTAWVVQLGSFTDEANATGLTERLKETGYSAFIEPLHDDGKTTFRVRVGPELSRPAADKIKKQLEQDLEIKGIVMRYP